MINSSLLGKMEKALQAEEIAKAWRPKKVLLSKGVWVRKIISRQPQSGKS